MGFHRNKSRKLPRRGRNKLPIRGKRGRRLSFLRQFDVGRVYSFVSVYELDDLPEDVTLWADDEWSH